LRTSNLVASVASVAVGSAVGKHDQGVPDDAPLEEDVPITLCFIGCRVLSWESAGTFPWAALCASAVVATISSMQMISDITDTYEKFGK
jgi:hypothetical protein